MGISWLTAKFLHSLNTRSSSQNIRKRSTSRVLLISASPTGYIRAAHAVYLDLLWAILWILICRFQALSEEWIAVHSCILPSLPVLLRVHGKFHEVPVESDRNLFDLLGKYITEQKSHINLPSSILYIHSPLFTAMSTGPFYEKGRINSPLSAVELEWIRPLVHKANNSFEILAWVRNKGLVFIP